jgi:hypothetical protein
MTIGDPKGTERIPNPNGANSKGLEYFGAGSTLPDEMGLDVGRRGRRPRLLSRDFLFSLGEQLAR